MKESYKYTILSLPIITILILAMFLASHAVSADDGSTSVVDEINITVPVSCTLSGTGMNTHNANINNGQYNSAIGETTLKAFCNDNNGFAIYAIGYTDNEEGKNVLTNSALGSTYDITTGTATTGNDSKWAMKLAAISDPTPTYPVIIAGSANDSLKEQGDPDFTAFQQVPDSYKKVAYRVSTTDTGSNAEGSTLKATYQAYISNTQPAGTYTGQVKYVMVHPNTAPEPIRDDQVEVVFNGNGLVFPDGTNTNHVVYGESCQTIDYGWVGDTPTISKTSNISDDGTMSAYNTSNSNIEDTVTIPGADRLIIELTYGYDRNGVIEIYVNGNSETGKLYNYYWQQDWENYEHTSHTELLLKTDTVTFSSLRLDEPTKGYYGYYAKIHPIYADETEGSSYTVLSETCGFSSQRGSYAETTTWNSYWYMLDNDKAITFHNESDIANYLNSNIERFGGGTVEIYAGNYYTVAFNANGGSGTMDNQDIYVYQSTQLDSSTFTLQGKEVISWNTKPDGTGTTYTISGYYDEPIANANIGETVVLYAQWGDCAPYSICYDDNGANSPTTMGKQRLTNSSHEDNLWASNFQRSGYGFAGWNTKADGTGTAYGPNQNPGFVYDDLASGGIRLYAMWVPSAGSIQNWSGCSSLNVGDVTALTDQRDNDTYAVAKLADGNCWMIENLRLDADATRGDANKALAQGYATSSTYGNFIGLADSELTFDNTTTANSLYYSGTQSGTASIDIGTDPWASDRFPRYNNDNTHNAQTGLNYSSMNANIYSMGNYYSWNAAMANTMVYSDPTNTDSNGKTSETVNTSICPKGWRLPYGNTTDRGNASGGFYYLYYKVNNNTGTTDSSSSNKMRSYPNNFILSGIASNGSINKRGSDEYSSGEGRYWSSTAKSRSFSYYFRLSTDSVDFSGSVGSYKRFGFSVRCVLISNQ